MLSSLISRHTKYELLGPALRLLMLVALVAQSLSATAPARAAGCVSPADCLSQMTLDEKIGQMTQVEREALASPSDITTYFLGALVSGGGDGPNGDGVGGTASEWADMYDAYQGYAIQTPLGIPLLYGVDAVHGHNNVYGTVLFPQNIGMGATRDPALLQQEEAVTRDEVLGTGMNWVFAPCVCVPQDDRWGRTFEGFGEDTALVQTMTAAAVQGFQGAGLSTTTVMSTAKHYMGDGGTTYGTGTGPFATPYLIDQGDTQIDEATLRAIHLPPFQTAVANHVGAVMISYSSWNGVKMHSNRYLITQVLKGELGFQGIVVTDWAGINAISPDYPTAVSTAINAGIDMVMAPSSYVNFINTLRDEVNTGAVPMTRIDDAVTRILTQKFALGLFSKYQTDRSYTAQVGSAAHRAVARQAVRESQVLLKNDGVLPLSQSATYKIVVGGSHVDDLGYQLGGWSISWQGQSGPSTIGTTFWQALQAAKPPNVTLQNVGTNTAGTYSGDVGIAVVGEIPYAEGLGDSPDLALSSSDATQVSDICSHTTKCIVILMSGRPLIINSQLNQANAFIEAWLPGTEGAGMTDVLFGDYNFSGKLPVTWPNDLSQEPINNGDGKVGLFPFGYGLKYPSTPKTVTFLSKSAQDGWVRESSENSNVGGAINTMGFTFSLGDDALNRQYRGILSFITGPSLPDGAVITGVTLRLRKNAVVGGGNPLTFFHGFMMDIKQGFFGKPGLQPGDFQAAADQTVGPIIPSLVNNWYSMHPASLNADINKLATNGGVTQIRLRFKLDDNNNGVTNTLSMFSGDVPFVYAPQLIITYHLP